MANHKERNEAIQNVTWELATKMAKLRYNKDEPNFDEVVELTNNAYCELLSQALLELEALGSSSVTSTDLLCLVMERTRNLEAYKRKTTKEDN